MNDLKNCLGEIHIRLILKYLLLISTFFAVCATHAQIPESYKFGGWEHAGYEVEYPVPRIQLNVKDWGATGDGVTDDTEAIMAAILSLGGRHGIIFFPQGSYKITQTLTLLDSCFLLGVDAVSSKLIFDLGGKEQPCIEASSIPTEDYVSLTEDLPKGADKIILPTSHNFKVGDHIEIIQDNGDWDSVPADWAQNSVGHLSQIISVSQDTAWLKEAVRIDMNTSLNLRVRKIDPIHHIYLSSFGIKRIDRSAFGYQMYLKYADGVKITGVESEYSVGSHLMVEACRRVSICGNYFHQAFEYDGVSTHGYGVTLIKHTNLAKIENNIFRKLRHAMMAKQGANGNIFAYNFAIETYRTEDPHDLSGDISLHGHYPYANLFEGNIVNNIVIDHYWGPSGEGNTFLRNRTLNYGISSFNFNTNSISTTQQVFIGNDVIPQLLPKGAFLVDSLQNTTYANLVRGVVVPASGEMLGDNSYYLTQRPSFWAVQLPWPSIGPPRSNLLYKIPAQYRYEQRDTLTVCDCSQASDYLEIPEELPTSISQATLSTPTTNLALTAAYIHNNHLIASIYAQQDGYLSLKAFDITGKQIFNRYFFHQKGSKTYSFSVANRFSSGIYIMSLENKHSMISRKFFHH